jgi:hypothetical protein
MATGGFDGLIVIWNSVSELPAKFLTARQKPISGQKPKEVRPAFLSPLKNNFITFFMYNVKSITQPRGSKQQSRRVSRLLSGKNVGEPNEMASDNDFDSAVTCLRFLNTRVYGKDSNLVTCGGNGWVRCWDVANARVSGEFISHAQGKYS